MHCGILILENNKTYGLADNKYYYKCIPNDSSMPHFLIPYKHKHIGFSKVYVNHYITFISLDMTQKHPIGQISQMIGYVDILDNFYEYQLYCKSLNSSIQKFSKDTISALKLMEYNQDHDTFIDNISLKFYQCAYSCKLQFEFCSFWASLRPNLAPEPVSMRQARKMVSNASKVRPVDPSSRHSVPIFLSGLKTQMQNGSLSGSRYHGSAR